MAYEEYFKKLKQNCQKTWESLSDDQKLYATCYLFFKLNEQLEEGGSFRKLIYDRLGFGAKNYTDLYCSGGMNITNILSVAHHNPEIFEEDI